MASKYVDTDKEVNQHRQRFLDIEANPSRKLMPIEGYANQPLVSLEEAVKPLVGLIPDIEAKAAWAKWKCEDPPADDLTHDQSAAIILYSMQWPLTENSLFDLLNKTLRDENRHELKPWFRYLKLFLTALGRLPSSSQIVYRGVKRDLRKEYQKGKTVIWWGFSSCTRTLDVLTADQFLGASGPRTLFNIECTSGKDIQKHSAFSFEDETLLPAARQFQVISCLPQGSDLYVVHLREIKSPVPLIELVSEASSSQSPPSLKMDTLKITSISNDLARWEAAGVTVAGGHGQGDRTDQLKGPSGLFVDEDQTLFIADYENHRIIAWKVNATTGEIIAGGKGQGSRPDQLNAPTDVIVDRETDSLLICDYGNRRVMRWPRRSSSSSVRQGEIVIDKITCSRFTMDDQGSLYISDSEKHEVRRYDKGGDKTGTVVAGGHRGGGNLNQLATPSYLFVDAQSTLYVSDILNHRVMKWMKGAKEGIVVAGGNGQGADPTQLSCPQGLWVDECGHIYVVDSWNQRVMRWEKDAKQGTVIVGGNGEGAKANQLCGPGGLFLDHRHYLYVTDYRNHRVQRFSPIIE